MNRRSFLAALAGAFALDPERAIWVPGKKKIFIPKPAEPLNIIALWTMPLIDNIFQQNPLFVRSPNGAIHRFEAYDDQLLEFLR